ncbi:hypothetical protein M8J77_003853 [Diaphorina citri]|nr:hypothetical protein M8J77_003853 [Diaphorina citri]
MATRLGYLLENQILVDVTLMCNTHTLKVHKVVLASCSPYFEGVLQKQLGTHPLIVLKDMKFSVLRSLIEFMYCGETSIAEDNLPALLDAAKFFEVKGLASMSRDAMSQPTSTTTTGNTVSTSKTNTTPNTSTSASTLSSNEHTASSNTSITGSLAIASSFSRGRGKITGRGRRSSFINSDPATTLLASANDPASILLSLSGSKPTSTGTGGLLTTKMKMSPGGGGGGRFAGAATAHSGKPNANTFLSNGSLGGGESVAHTEPRRRGRRKLNETLFDKSGPATSSLAHSIEKSPLLASLLATEQAKQKGTATLITDPRYAEMLKKVPGAGGGGGGAGSSQDQQQQQGGSSLFYTQNGSGDLVTLDGTDQTTYLTVLGGSGEEGEGGEVTEAVVMQDGTICTAEGNHIAVDAKFVQSPHPPPPQSTTSPSPSSSLLLTPPPSCSSSSCQLPIKTAVMASLKQETPPTTDPDAVVLYEMNEESNSLDKYVISSEEVRALRLLNQLVKQNNMSKGDISNMIMSNDESSNTQIAEIDLMLGGGRGKCKSLIRKILEMGNGLKGTLEKVVANKIPPGNNNNNSMCSSGGEERIGDDNTNSNCSTSVQDAGSDGFLLTHEDNNQSVNTQQISTDEFLIENTNGGVLIENENGVLIENGDGVLIENGDGVLLENNSDGVLLENNGGGVLLENSHGEVDERRKVREINVEMAFKAMMGEVEDNYVTSVDADKVDDEFKLHNEEDSHSSSHSFSSSQHKIILSNVLMNSGEEMNILAHMDAEEHKDLELLDDDCSQEEYLKSTPYSVEEFITHNKRKSTDEDHTGVKKQKYDDFNHHNQNHDYNHDTSNIMNATVKIDLDGLNDCNSQET